MDNNDQKLQNEHAANNDDLELIIVDESMCTTDLTVRPLQGEARKRAEEYLEKLKKYRPMEYEELMKNG